MSNSEVYLTRDEIEHPYANLTVMLEDKRRKAEQMSKTVFSSITKSPETLAPKLVYIDSSQRVFNTIWRSTLLPNKYWKTEAEAIAATVAELKEVTG